MNEDEILEILQGLDDMKHLEINPEYKVKIINGILDLYNKEKEKNKSLEQENSFLKMMYRGTDEFKNIERYANGK